MLPLGCTSLPHLPLRNTAEVWLTLLKRQLSMRATLELGQDETMSVKPTYSARSSLMSTACAREAYYIPIMAVCNKNTVTKFLFQKNCVCVIVCFRMLALT